MEKNAKQFVVAVLSQQVYFFKEATEQAGWLQEAIVIFDQAALVSKTWLDADPVQSNQIFGSMIDSITSGQSSIYQALGDGSSQYNVVLQQATGQ